MINLLILSIPWWVVSLSGVMSPGPISTLSISEGARRGVRAGPLISVGHALTELVMVGALAVGLNQVLQQDVVAGVIALIGGAVLLWMGYDIAGSAWRGRVALPAQGGHSQGVARLGLVSAGVLLSITNPFWLLWWATVGSANMIRFLKYGLLGLAVFYVGHILLDFGWNSFLAFAGASGREVLKDRGYRGILLVCGLFLMGLSACFVISGIGFLRR